MEINRLEYFNTKIQTSNVSILTLRKENNEYHIKEVPTDESMITNLKDIGSNTLALIKKWADDNDKTEIEELNLEDEVTKIFYVNLCELETYNQFKDKILEYNLQEQNLRNENNIKNIKAFIVHYEYLDDNNEIKRIDLFQKFSSANLFHRKKFFTVYIDGEYKALSNDTFSMENTGDVIIIEEDAKALVRHKQNFEKIFDFEKIHKEFATKFFSTPIHSNIDISDIKDRVIKSKGYCREIYKISKNQRYNDIDIPHLINLNQNLNLNLNINDGIWKIAKGDKLDVIFKILNRGLGKDALINRDEFFLADSFKNINP